MDTIGRKTFWNELCRIRDNTPENLQALRATIKVPEKVCRFRSVSENSLLQLQENKLYYSSADYYDDPFDTFIHFDYSPYSACMKGFDMSKKKNEVTIRSSAAEYLTYVASTGDNPQSIEIRYEDENIWLTQKVMARLYDITVPTINYHINKIFRDSELQKESVIRKFLITAEDQCPILRSFEILS